MIEKVNQTLSWSLVKRCCLEAKSPASSGPFPMHSAKKKKKKSLHPGKDPDYSKHWSQQ